MKYVFLRNCIELYEPIETQPRLSEALIKDNNSNKYRTFSVRERIDVSIFSIF